MIYPQNSAGVVTVYEWTCMPDGESYKHIWCNDWQILTDKEVPIEGFRSVEKWQLLGHINGEVVCVIPGCQVKGWAACKEPIRRNSVYCIERAAD